MTKESQGLDGHLSSGPREWACFWHEADYLDGTLTQQLTDAVENQLGIVSLLSNSSIRPNSASPEIRPGESAARLGYRHQLLNRLVERMALGDDLIDDAEG